MSAFMPSLWRQTALAQDLSHARDRPRPEQGDVLSRLLGGRPRVVVVSMRGAADDMEVSTSVCSGPTARGCEESPELAGHLRQGLRRVIRRWAARRAPTALASSLMEAPQPAADDECAICYGTVENETRLWCGHRFCQDCIDRWLVSSETCPTCRRIVVPRTAELQLVRRGPLPMALWFRARAAVYAIGALGVLVLFVVWTAVRLASAILHHVVTFVICAMDMGCATDSRPS